MTDDEETRYRYFVTRPGEPEREVSADGWRAAERAAGFHSKLGPGHNATAGFAGMNGISGRLVLRDPGSRAAAAEPGHAAHPQEQLMPPGSDEPVSIDTEMVPLIRALWAAGYTTITCCQDFGESVASVSPRWAAFWQGRAQLELPRTDALALIELAAAHGFLMHWAQDDAWQASIPVVMLGARALAPALVQVKFPASQLERLTAVVERHGRQFRKDRR
jgi:hypothetical protein